MKNSTDWTDQRLKNFKTRKRGERIKSKSKAIIYSDVKIKHKNQSENVIFRNSKIFIENIGVGVMSV